MNKEKYQVVIGLEVHAQLLTKSKLFCGDSATFGADANTHISAISLAHPGTLPVLNKEVVALAVKLGLALNCSIASQNYFARKNYFYPDLPKGFQTSQHTDPICVGGFLTVDSNRQKKDIQLNRIHIEEDAGKSMHDLYTNFTAIDLNRAGTALLEIVTEPCIHSAQEAFNYLTDLRKIVRWLNVCDGNMEEGSMRCDANISVRLQGDTKLGTRVEVKNLNSIRNVKRAIELETKRLIKIVEAGETIVQETRSYNADNNTTFSLRSKEDADDYRYFPEPDLTPIQISEAYKAAILAAMPVLPSVQEKLLVEKYNLSTYDANAICADKEDVVYFENLVAITKNAKASANWLTGPIRNYCTEKNITLSAFPLNINTVADLINFTNSGKVHFNIASTKLMHGMIAENNNDPEGLAVSMNLLQEDNDDAINDWIQKTILAMPDKVKEYKAGKKGLIGLFAGQVKKLSAGKADMGKVNALLEKKLME
jgi:aspartyl-tRNA(Asn)/glutamyl-tRNA(Gln) amidotransferase subunit B